MAEHSSSAVVPPSTDAERPKVVYVMGAGRSGSTILGVALGNCDDVFFAGELNTWLPRSGVPSREDPERTQFWSGVRDEVGGATELFGGRTTCLDRSSALLDLRKWPARRRLRAPYRRVSESLYHAIKRATGVSHIVDTSHYPLRALELKALRGIDLYILYLVRDPRRVVESLGRRDVPERTFNVPTSNLYLWLTHVLAVFVFLRHRQDRRLLVRHEDFLANPERVLSQILHRVDSSAEPPESTSLSTGIPFHGNRLLGSEVVVLEHRAEVPVHGSRATELLQLPWRAVFSRLRPATDVPEPTTDTVSGQM